MNETATFLHVPKRRVYDVCGVLEGVGILEKRSKNTVAWKGSEAILGTSIDLQAKEQLEALREETGQLHKEEAQLDMWMNQLFKSRPTVDPVYASDILEALFYSDDSPEVDLVDQNGKPTRSVLAVHAPFDSVAYMPKTSEEEISGGQLFIGTESGVDKMGERTSQWDARKRKENQLLLPSHKGAKIPRQEDKVQVFVLPTYYDDKEKKIKSLAAKPLEEDFASDEDPGKGEELGRSRRTSSWDVAESLANDEGVSGFFDADGEVP